MAGARRSTVGAPVGGDGGLQALGQGVEGGQERRVGAPGGDEAGEDDTGEHEALGGCHAPLLAGALRQAVASGLGERRARLVDDGDGGGAALRRGFEALDDVGAGAGLREAEDEGLVEPRRDGVAADQRRRQRGGGEVGLEGEQHGAVAGSVVGAAAGDGGGEDGRPGVERCLDGGVGVGVGAEHGGDALGCLVHLLRA